jgi:predicted tellurium resistance membrane protein TerC
VANLAVMLGILILPFLSLRLTKRFWPSIILSTISLAILVHVAGWLGAGYIDPTYPISIPVSLVVFFCWSFAVIWVIHFLRKKRNELHTD